jgi:hypothetical protein
MRREGKIEHFDLETATLPESCNLTNVAEMVPDFLGYPDVLTIRQQLERSLGTEKRDLQNRSRVVPPG